MELKSNIINSFKTTYNIQNIDLTNIYNSYLEYFICDEYWTKYKDT
jgi:hypothetical protein